MAIIKRSINQQIRRQKTSHLVTENMNQSSKIFLLLLSTTILSTQTAEIQPERFTPPEESSVSNGQFIHRQIASSNDIDLTPFLFQAQLLKYVNPGNRVPYSGFNSKPGVQYTCTGLADPTTMSPCQYFFTLTVTNSQQSSITKAQQTVKSTNGTIDLTQLQPWGAIVGYPQTSKPWTLEVIVYHYGTVYDAQTDQIVISNRPVFVDSFFFNLQQQTPLERQVNQQNGFQTSTLTGNSVQSQLTLTWALRCDSGSTGVGPNCDLKCSSNGVCTKSVNGQTVYSICQRETGTPFPYWGACVNCPFGVANGACAPMPTSSPPNANTMACPSNLVASGYQGATTALAILFVICLVIIAFLLFKMYSDKRKADEKEYLRKREEWKDVKSVELGARGEITKVSSPTTPASSNVPTMVPPPDYDNKAYNAHPDPDVSFAETDATGSSRQNGSVASSRRNSEESYGKNNNNNNNNNNNSHDSHDQNDNNNSSAGDGSMDGPPPMVNGLPPSTAIPPGSGRTTPRIEARV